VLIERSSYREWEPGEDVVLVVGPAGVDVGDPLVDRRRLVGVPQHLERVLQAGQLGGADHHGDGLAVPRQDQALEGALDLGGKAAKVGIAFERHGGHVLVMPRNGGGDERFRRREGGRGRVGDEPGSGDGLGADDRRARHAGRPGEGDQGLVQESLDRGRDAGGLALNLDGALLDPTRELLDRGLDGA